MINKREISIEWLNQVAKQHRNADIILTEKVIRALLLLEDLAKQNLPFVFKGQAFSIIEHTQYFDKPQILTTLNKNHSIIRR